MRGEGRRQEGGYSCLGLFSRDNRGLAAVRGNGSNAGELTAMVFRGERDSEQRAWERPRETMVNVPALLRSLKKNTHGYVFIEE
jgi:predicted dienelactone hydrolase